ncbi:hypothetical protein BJ138DRAFT_736979 [Hygrophoropsis aurantiaca]|uniref:Uncharacterized protein n=1 Tax=Hygrophoropsis aurantiaca TaxID=72124 RepID=A0ACB8AIF0_9AGAM|nr:hypothetical protein BJ138DRAFT_736979 [Hygrophoropsis aurantiaca]
MTTGHTEEMFESSQNLLPPDSPMHEVDIMPPPYTSSTTGSPNDPPKWEPHFVDFTSQSNATLDADRMPLDPPPNCFSMPSPLRVKTHDFPPFKIQSVSNQLSAGFRILYPSHLLEKHGISQLDWIRFLEDLGIAARLAMRGLTAVGSRLPSKPFPARGIFSSRASGTVYDSRFTRNPKEEVEALIGVWNQSAFERRKLRVTLQPPTGQDGARFYRLVVESL